MRFGSLVGMAGLAVAIAATAPAARADTIKLGYLYVADYGLSIMERYQYTYNQTQNMITAITPYGVGGNTTNAYFLGNASTSPVKEGVHGTANDLIIVGGYHGSGVTNITRYTLDGQFIGEVPVNFSSYNGGNVGIGNVLVTPDGRYMYAPLETAGYIVKIDLTNGAIVNSVAFAGAHDVAIAANGDVYAANYAAGAGTAKVIVLDSNLVKRQDLITTLPAGVPGASFRPTGLSIAADGSLYVNANQSVGSTTANYNSILHYNISGAPGSQTATYDAAKSYVASATNNKIQFAFGNNIGPDGKVYVAALGGGRNAFTNIPSGYVDGVYAFDPLTGQATLAIAGYTEKTGPDGPSGLAAPKYLQFDTNFIPVSDQGYTPVPEPASAALLLAGLVPLALRRRGGSRAPADPSAA